MSMCLTVTRSAPSDAAAASMLLLAIFLTKRGILSSRASASGSQGIVSSSAAPLADAAGGDALR